MMFYIFTSIVFIAEVIIGITLIIQLLKWRKNFKNWNSLLKESESDIAKIADTSKKISEQLVELAPYWVKNFRNYFLKILFKNIKSGLISICILMISQKLGKTK